MQMIIVLFFGFHTIAVSFAKTFETYSAKWFIRPSVDVAYMWHIGSYRFKNQINCLVQCNLIDACLTATFNTDSSCDLYSKYFSINELLTSKDFNYFTKNYSDNCKFFNKTLWFSNFFYKLKVKI